MVLANCQLMLHIDQPSLRVNLVTFLLYFFVIGSFVNRCLLVIKPAMSGELKGAALGFSEDMMAGMRKSKSKVVAPRNPKLLKGFQPEVKVSTL